MAYTADTATEIDSYKGDPSLALGGGVASALASQSKPDILLDGIAQGLDEFAKKREAKKLEFQKAFSDELKSTSDTAGILEKDTPEIMALQKDLYRYIQQNPQVLSADAGLKYQDAHAEFMAKEKTLARAIQKSKDDVAFDKALQAELFKHPNAVNQKLRDDWKAKSLKDRTAFSLTVDPSEALVKMSNTIFGDNTDIDVASEPTLIGENKTVDPYHNTEVTTISYKPEILSKFISEGKKVAQQYYLEFDQLDKDKKDALVAEIKDTLGDQKYTDSAILDMAKEAFVENRVRQFAPKNDKITKKDIVTNFYGQLKLAQAKADIGVQASNAKLDYKLEVTPQKEAPEDKADRINYNIQLDIDKVVPSDNQPAISVANATYKAKFNNLSGQLWNITAPMTNSKGQPNGKNKALIDISPSFKTALNGLLGNPKHIMMLVDTEGKRTYFASSDGKEVDATKYATTSAVKEAMFDDKDINKRYDIAYPEASDNKEQSQPSTKKKKSAKELMDEVK